MKKTMLKGLSAVVVAGMIMLASCNKSNDNPLSVTDTQNVNSESVSASQSNEASDLTNSVMDNVTDTQLAQARMEWTIDLSGKDGRLKGATITINGTGTKDDPTGTITIDFGSGTTGADGITRSGQIVITYSGKRFQEGSTRSISFNNYSRNKISLTGTILVTVTSVDSTTTVGTWVITHSHTTPQALTFTFADKSTATRTATYTSVWTIVWTNLGQSTLTHKKGGTANGTTRKGASYNMSITSDIVYSAACVFTGYYFPQSGAKTLSVTNAGSSSPNIYTFTFGSGSSTSCTNTVTIAYNGKTKTITISGDGN